MFRRPLLRPSCPVTIRHCNVNRDETSFFLSLHISVFFLSYIRRRLGEVAALVGAEVKVSRRRYADENLRERVWGGVPNGYRERRDTHATLSNSAWPPGAARLLISVCIVSKRSIYKRPNLMSRWSHGGRIDHSPSSSSSSLSLPLAPPPIFFIETFTCRCRCLHNTYGRNAILTCVGAICVRR